MLREFRGKLRTISTNFHLVNIGDPTPKYMMIRDAIKDYVSLPNITIPAIEPKMRISPLQLYPRTTLLSVAARRALGKTPIFSVQPVTFESLDQYSGFVLYETLLPTLKLDPSVLSVPKISDRAIVLIDDVNFVSLGRPAHTHGPTSTTG